MISKRNDLGWEIYPEGLAEFLREYAKYRLPILITENGVPAENDDDRWVFIYMHLWQVARALANGIDVAGYLHWSLLDNYEWADGYAARFGLVGVDFETQQRTVRDSARRLANIIARNEL
jgi:beta-glucosidase